MKRRICSLALLLSMIFGLLIIPSDAEAKASAAALKVLKGTWGSASRSNDGGPGHTFYIRFSKKYAKYYYYDSSSKKLKLDYKDKISSTKKIKNKKLGNGYAIRLKHGKFKYSYWYHKGQKYMYFYEGWKEDPYKQSGSNSVRKIKI